jgi:hypothetical protein
VPSHGAIVCLSVKRFLKPFTVHKPLANKQLANKRRYVGSRATPEDRDSHCWLDTLAGEYSAFEDSAFSFECSEFSQVMSVSACGIQPVSRFQMVGNQSEWLESRLPATDRNSESVWKSTTGCPVLNLVLHLRTLSGFWPRAGFLIPDPGFDPESFLT